ncbi:MAG: U32 family peptidase [Oscillospiraceae bacterium]|nr:U32 family peptidase [Oscillospiraceae bacterium]
MKEFLNKSELLAPAGSMESIYAAVRCGADAVYVGGARFSARANATNFTDEELLQAVEYCHLHGVKVYRAMNTVVFAEEMADFLAAAKHSAEIGVDGLIVQDIGAARLLREMLPDMKLNASTQMTIHTPEGARLAKEMGFSRVVAARELSLEQLKEMTDTGIEIEAFVHGALCMSVSGQCFMSAMIGSRSANRGMCAQACRLPFSAVGGKERYDLSLKDLCGIPQIDRLGEIGIASLKIEGRMKRAEYVAAAVTACRAALDGNEPDLDTLKAVFSRSGFTDGYLTGKLGTEMFGYRRKEDVVSAEGVFPELREKYRKETKAASADFAAYIKNSEPSRLEMTCDGITVSAEGAVPEVAKNRPADRDYITRQLDKLGDTVYTLGNIHAEIDDGLMLPASAINALRREAVEKMDAARIAATKPEQRYNEVDLGFKRENRYTAKIRVKITSAEQLAGTAEADEVVVPLKLWNKVAAAENIIIELPRFVDNEEQLKKQLEAVRQNGFTHILCTNLAHIPLGKALGFTLHGGFGLNIVSPYSVETARQLGLDDVTASFEMKASQLPKICGNIPVGVIGYGYLPVMLTRNCPVKQAVGGCKNCTGKLTDRTGREFKVKCNGVSCEILNSDLLMMSDRMDEICADFVQLDFTDETTAEIKRVIGCYRDGRKLADGGFTRGLYYRGIE